MTLLAHEVAAQDRPAGGPVGAAPNVRLVAKVYGTSPTCWARVPDRAVTWSRSASFSLSKCGLELSEEFPDRGFRTPGDEPLGFREGRFCFRAFARAH